jgi:drug/metabolite transporter (DMT)-like permease
VATGWHMILGGLPLLGLSGLWETEQWVNLQAGDWLSLSYSTVFGSAIAYALFFFFAATGNLTSLSSLTFLTPIFALLFSNLFLSETLDPLQWFGVGLTLVSIYLINQREQLLERFKKVPEALATVEAESDR